MFPSIRMEELIIEKQWYWRQNIKLTEDNIVLLSWVFLKRDVVSDITETKEIYGNIWINL